MTTSRKTEAADRHHGGPGSSHQNADQPDASDGSGPADDQPTRGPDSRASGGGGEPDRRRGHEPARK